MMRGSGLSMAGVTLLALAGCSTAIPKRLGAGERREQFLQFAGPPVDSFTYLRPYYAWRPLGNQQVAIWTDINDAYLITVLAPCVGLDFTNGIRLTSTNHTVTRGVDAVEFDHQHCVISQMRPVDYLAMKKATHSLP